MKITELSIHGVYLLEPVIHGDKRGYFFESFSQRDFESAIGKEVSFVQDNESFSRFGTIRGLHYQKGEYAQAKLVRVVRGRILDVVLDLRVDSPTFGKWLSVELDGESHRQLFVPRGFAHGFSVLSEDALFQYKCDNYYAPAFEGSVNAVDDALNIDWRVDFSKMTRSEKDIMAPYLSEIPKENLF